ncbi:MAG: 1,4-alpha-glucan branching enzyme [Lachnospiraceae bacterium]|nr:1,4-alpha-glucan branching enzyme [Lachnospiraceae bacterium]
MAMSKKLYNLMDWAEIEAVAYSEEDHPKAVLGAHPVRGGQTLVTAYCPEASKVEIRMKGEKHAQTMELADEEGYFAILVKNREPFEYTFVITDKEGNKTEQSDPYSFPGVITKRDVQKFNSGLHYRAYEILGAHPMTMNGIPGTHFAVWAPSAIRVSVVGDFNGWDGRFCQMERLWESGIFELFLPGVKEGAIYKYEIKLRSGVCLMKSDPYAFDTEGGAEGASIVADLNHFIFADDDWIEGRGRIQGRNMAVSILDADLRSFLTVKDQKTVFDPQKAAASLSGLASAFGFTHIALSDVFDPMDGFYSPAAVYGGASTIMSLVNELHKNDIGVILDLNVAKFPCHASGLMEYDGSCLYEDPDPKRHVYPEGDNRYFNLGRSEVRNFLMADALFLVSVFHADGLRLPNMAQVLYLDYGKQGGGFTPNIYGGNENLDAIDFFRDLNTVLDKMSGDILTIADDESAFPGITAPQADSGLGFSFKLNTGWTRDTLGYLKHSPLSRSAHYNELCFPMIYQYNEHFILPLSHRQAALGRKTLFDLMAGDNDEKFSCLRALYAYFTFHPGKKLIYPGGGDYAGFTPGKKPLFPETGIEERMDAYFGEFFRDLMQSYLGNPALYELDSDMEGFEWINNISANENIIVFARRSSRKDDVLVCLANFISIPRKEYKIGVPQPGKYTEIFNSDEERYGGFGFTNPKVLTAAEDECDGRPYSIRVKVAPMGVALFKLTQPKQKS